MAFHSAQAPLDSLAQLLSKNEGPRTDGSPRSGRLALGSRGVCRMRRGRRSWGASPSSAWDGASAPTRPPPCMPPPAAVAGLSVLRRSSHPCGSGGVRRRPLLLFLNSTWLRHTNDLWRAGWLRQPQVLLKSSEFSTPRTWSVLSTLKPKMIHIWLWNVFLQVLLNISDIQKPPKNSDEDCQLMEKARVGGGGRADLPEPAPCVTGRGRTGTSASWFASTCSPCRKTVREFGVPEQRLFPPALTPLPNPLLFHRRPSRIQAKGQYLKTQISYGYIWM